jgi:hypothetical protein
MKVIKSLLFHPTIYNELNNYNINFETTLGISIRTWTASHEYNIRREYSFEIYKNAIIDVLSKNKMIDTIILSLDNEIVEPQYLSLLQQFPNINIIIYREKNVNHLQYVIIKMLLLSKSKFFICNRISTFSELVFWFSECKQTVIPLF